MLAARLPRSWSLSPGPHPDAAVYVCPQSMRTPCTQASSVLGLLGRCWLRGHPTATPTGPFSFSGVLRPGRGIMGRSSPEMSFCRPTEPPAGGCEALRFTNGDTEAQGSYSFTKPTAGKAAQTPVAGTPKGCSAQPAAAPTDGGLHFTPISPRPPSFNCEDALGTPH